MSFEIPSPSYSAYVTLVGITLLAACVPFFGIRKEGFATVLKKSFIAVLLVVPFTLGIAWTINDNAFDMSGKNLSVRAAYFYNYSRSLDDFYLSKAQLGSYQSIAEAKLKWRQSGVGLPGINAGRFSTNEGDSIFVMLTDRSQVLYLPARSGDSLLISVSDATAVLEALKRENSLH